MTHRVKGSAFRNPSFITCLLVGLVRNLTQNFPYLCTATDLLHEDVVYPVAEISMLLYQPVIQSFTILKNLLSIPILFWLLVEGLLLDLLTNSGNRLVDEANQKGCGAIGRNQQTLQVGLFPI